MGINDELRMEEDRKWLERLRKMAEPELLPYSTFYKLVSIYTKKTGKIPDHPTALAINKYVAGEQPQVTTFIDETTLMYGYGECSDMGTWQFTIPPCCLIKGERLTKREKLEEETSHIIGVMIDKGIKIDEDKLKEIKNDLRSKKETESKLGTSSKNKDK